MNGHVQVVLLAPGCSFADGGSVYAYDVIAALSMPPHPPPPPAPPPALHTQKGAAWEAVGVVL